MQEIFNLNNKRVLDLTQDKTIAEIRKKDCVTIITANKDGTLNIIQKRIYICKTK